MLVRLRPVAVAALLLSAGRLPAQFDELRVGNANGASPGVVVVPVYLRDVAGTPLGKDRYERIAGVAFSVTFPPGLGLSATTQKAGVLGALTLDHERSASRPDGAGLFLWLTTYSSPFVTTTGFGDHLANLVLTIPPGLAPGTKIDLTLAAGGCMLSSVDARTLEEPPALALLNGAVVVGAHWGDATKDGTIDLFDLVALANYIAGNVHAGEPPFLATADLMNLDPAKGTKVDIFDLVLLSGYLVGNVPALPVP